MESKKPWDYGRSLLQDICLTNLLVNSVLKGNKHGAYYFDWNNMGNHSANFSMEYSDEDARFLLQMSLMITNANYREVKLEVPNWLIDTPIYYENCPTNNKISPGRNNYKPALAHILYNKNANLIFIVFSGTVDTCMISIDLNYIQDDIKEILNYNPGMKCHRGIYIAYLSIRSQLIQAIIPYINMGAKIIITGHSLGGGLSNICALDLSYYDPLHYSFASPLIFNPISSQIFDRLVNKSFRIANISDLVVLAPLPIMPNKDIFCHVGQSIVFQNNLGDYRENHSLAYLQKYNIDVKYMS